MDYKFKTTPYKHQLVALQKSWNKESYAYLMEMGTGKTKVLIDNAAMLYDKGKIDGVLIVAPKGVIGTWYKNEIPTHWGDGLWTLHCDENICKAEVDKQIELAATAQEKLDYLEKIGF